MTTIKEICGRFAGGVIDVVALNARGIFNVAAIGGHGKYLTPRRWAALRALEVQQVTLLLDNDEYGKEGTVAALGAASGTLAAPDVMAVDPTKLAPYKDPDELVRFEGVDAFRLLISRESIHGRDYTRLARGLFRRHITSDSTRRRSSPWPR